MNGLGYAQATEAVAVGLALRRSVGRLLTQALEVLEIGEWEIRVILSPGCCEEAVTEKGINEYPSVSITPAIRHCAHTIAMVLVYLPLSNKL